MKIKVLPKVLSSLVAFLLIVNLIIPTTVSRASNPGVELEPVLEDVLASDIDLIEEISIDIELSEEVLSENFDLEEAVANIPSIDEMNEEEKLLFDNVVQELIDLLNLTGEAAELYENALNDFFDHNSETYHQLDLAQEILESDFEELAEEELSFIQASINNILGINEVHAVSLRIGVNFAGSVLNVAIGVAVGGGVGAIQAVIIKKGKKEAEKLFTRTVVSRLNAWGASKLAWAAGAAVAIALDYLDVGTQIAKQIDRRDKRPNNGWIDIT